MVSDVVHLNTTISQRIKHEEEEKDDEDTCSVSTTSTDNCDGGAVVLQDTEDRAPCFQNIEVTNSSDVHFGNKTYYQGPVTIKQVLYTNRDGEKSQHTNGLHPPLAINDNKCAVDNVSYANYNDGYTTDNTIHHITSNGQTKLPNGIHDHFEPIRGGSNGQKFTKNQWLLIGLGVTLAMMLIVTAVALIFTLKPSESSNENLTENSPILEDPDAQGEVTIVDRTSWVATDPVSVIPLSNPVPNIIISETQSVQCFEKKDCIRYVRHLQNHHIEAQHKSDIIYNFLVGSDGYVYYGRGWKAQPDVVANCNRVSLAIGFIGSFSDEKPSKAQIVATKRLIRIGVISGIIKGNYRIAALSQILGGNEGTGKELLEEIQQWPGWTPKDYSKDITEREMFCKGL